MAGGTLGLSLSLSLPTAGGSGGGTKLWNSIGRVFEDYFGNPMPAGRKKGKVSRI